MRLSHEWMMPSLEKEREREKKHTRRAQWSLGNQDCDSRMYREKKDRDSEV